MPKYAPEIYGPLGKYLGHFRKPEFLAQGHNQTDPKKLKKEEDDETLREAEAAIARLEAAGFGKEKPKPAPKPAPRREEEEDFAGIKARSRALRQLGVR